MTARSYAANRAETAKTISELLGQATASKKQRSLSGKGVLGARSVSESAQEFARPLMTPDEVLRLPFEDALLFVGGAPPYRGRKIMYYLDDRLASRAGLPRPDSARAQRREFVGGARSEWEAIPIAPGSPPVAPPRAAATGPALPASPATSDPADRPSESAWAEMFGDPAAEPEELTEGGTATTERAPEQPAPAPPKLGKLL